MYKCSQSTSEVLLCTCSPHDQTRERRGQKNIPVLYPAVIPLLPNASSIWDNPLLYHQDTSVSTAALYCFQTRCIMETSVLRSCQSKTCHGFCENPVDPGVSLWLLHNTTSSSCIPFLFRCLRISDHVLLTSATLRFPPFVIGSLRDIQTLVKCLVIARQEEKKNFGVGVWVCVFLMRKCQVYTQLPTFLIAL